MTYKAWQPNTFYNKGEIFSFLTDTYQVLDDFNSSAVFKANDSRITIFKEATGGGGGSYTPPEQVTLLGDGSIVIPETFADSSILTLRVNGVAYTNTGVNPPFIIVDGSIIWNASVAGFALDSFDTLTLG